MSNSSAAQWQALATGLSAGGSRVEPADALSKLMLGGLDRTCALRSDGQFHDFGNCQQGCFEIACQDVVAQSRQRAEQKIVGLLLKRWGQAMKQAAKVR